MCSRFALGSEHLLRARAFHPCQTLPIEPEDPAMHSVALYDVPGLYDRVVRTGPCESFYGDLARQTGGPILELACGTGRLTIPLARDGHEVVGLDASRTMLRA